MTGGKLSGCKKDEIGNVRDGKCSDSVLKHTVTILVVKRSCWPTWSTGKTLDFRSRVASLFTRLPNLHN